MSIIFKVSPLKVMPVCMRATTCITCATKDASCEPILSVWYFRVAIKMFKSIDYPADWVSTLVSNPVLETKKQDSSGHSLPDL